MDATSTPLTVQSGRELSAVESAAIKALLYFDVFQYPLTEKELHHFLASQRCDVAAVRMALQHLMKIQLVEQYGDYYYLSGHRQHVQARLEKEERAIPYNSKMLKYSKVIGAFPFVRGVMITGSLAKNCMDEKGDIDYMVITAPDRLWITRFMLVLYKKLFLFDSRKYFCTNYYLSTSQMQIPDRNIFTATEITTALPVYDQAFCDMFFQENLWVEELLPNSAFRKNAQAHTTDSGMLKRGLEKLMGGALGDWMDNNCMRLFTWRWQQKFGRQQGQQFSINFRSSKNVSKHHPHGFQFKVLSGFNERIVAFEQQHSIKLS